MNTQLPSPARTLRLRNATPERLRELTAANLDALEAILRWNELHAIQVFRLSSNLVPLASHPANRLRWWRELAGRFRELGSLLDRTGARVSTHPGQYTVLSSREPNVVAAAFAELEYHARMLAAFGLDESHKIVVHVGSARPDRASARKRFDAGFARLPEHVQVRLVLENDERWPLADVLAVAEPLGLPVAFDAFHHLLAPSLPELGLRGALLSARATWHPRDGRQEVHFSTQEPGKRQGAHAETLDLVAFRAFADEVADLPLDCVLEVKDKEQSVLRARETLGSRAG